MATDFVEEPFSKPKIVDGIALLEWPDGSRRGIPLRVFRIEHARAGQALAEYDARQGEVIPIRGG